MTSQIDYSLKVIYSGAVKDLSGYGSAARDYVRSLDAAGVDVTLDALSFENQPRRFVEEILERRLWTMMGKPLTPKMQIIHLTPDNYNQYRNNSKIKIGYFAWETSSLPASWIEPINSICREVWVPCKYLADVSRNSGVTIPVQVIPHAIPTTSSFQPSCALAGLPEDKYKFYSIFQWSERKNPLALLQAYYQEFSKDDPVIYIIKTYRVGTGTSERDFIRREISKLKKITKGVNCPPILLIEDYLSVAKIKNIHYFGDCYVSMARSEGFGLPIFEAAAMANPVIVPNYSAFPEFFNEENSYLVDVPNEVPIRDMKHISILYTGNMLWGDPSIDSCRKRMREAFNNQDQAKEKGLRARKMVEDQLSYQTIGRLMRDRLELIQKEIV